MEASRDDPRQARLDTVVKPSAMLDFLASSLGGALRLCSWKTALIVGAAAGRAAGPLQPSKRSRTFENLSRAGFSDPRGGATKAWKAAGETLLEMLWLTQRDAKDALQLVEIDGLDVLRAAGAPGCGVLLVSAHLGNWELVALAAARSGLPVAVVARTLKTPKLERKLVAFRQGGGVRTLLRGQPGASVCAARWLLRGGVLGCMMDRASRGQRVLVPFLGRSTKVPLGPVELACRAGSAVVLGSARRLPDKRTRVSFRMLETGAKGDPKDLAVRVGGALEEEVRARPEEWFWIYRRQPDFPRGMGMESGDAAVESDVLASSS